MPLSVSGAPLTEISTRCLPPTATFEMVDMRLSVEENWKRRRTVICAVWRASSIEEGAIWSPAPGSATCWKQEETRTRRELPVERVERGLLHRVAHDAVVEQHECVRRSEAKRRLETGVLDGYKLLAVRGAA